MAYLGETMGVGLYNRYRHQFSPTFQAYTGSLWGFTELGPARIELELAGNFGSGDLAVAALPTELTRRLDQQEHPEHAGVRVGEPSSGGLRWERSTRAERAADLLRDHGKALVHVDFAVGELTVEALASPLGVHKASAQGSTYLYVNGRFVRDPVERSWIPAQRPDQKIEYPPSMRIESPVWKREASEAR